MFIIYCDTNMPFDLLFPTQITFKKQTLIIDMSHPTLHMVGSHIYLRGDILLSCLTMP